MRPFASTLGGFWENPTTSPSQLKEPRLTRYSPGTPLPLSRPGEDLARGPGSGDSGGSRGAGAVFLSRVVPPLPNPQAKLCGRAGGHGPPLSALWDRLTSDGWVAESVSVTPTPTTTTWAIP